ncbi:MAG TPA: Ig-like domain-containing protein, partial [bacterium]|nr:Ig-like domain-containing protein [bacterium]
MKGFLFALLVVTISAAAGCGGGGGVAPTVLSSNATGDRLYPTTPISVTFSTAMDEASVEEAFEITGSGPVEGAFSWTDATVTFTPSALWKTHHPYTLTIGTGAKDAGGSAIAEAYTQTFRTNINMHDVNADGIDDLLVSAPLNDESGPKSGMAYL